MKHFDVISIFPGMFDALTKYGISGRAFENGLCDLVVWNPRDFSINKSSSIDARPYGGGAGMVMTPEPLMKAWCAASSRQASLAEVRKTRTIYLSPQGQVLNGELISDLGGLDGLILIAGRYEGVDERVIDLCVDQEISLGDYVISGGELPAMVLMDALAREIPGAVNCCESITRESFSNGLLDYPQYTRPKLFKARKVPEVLLSGNHMEIAKWRLKESLGRTWIKRPDLIEKITLKDEELNLLSEFKKEKGVN